MYFQLYPSMLPTEGTEFGLLPTTRARDGVKGSDRELTYKDGKWKNLDKNGTAFGMTLEQAVRLLPTPQAMDCMTNPPRQITESGRIISNQGHNGSAPLKDLAMNGLLPTPTAMDSTGATANMKSTQVKEWSMHSVTLSRAMAMGILPTPKVGGQEGYETRAKRQGHEKAISHLEAFVEFHTQILPTPMASDCGDKVTGLENQDSLTKRARLETGTTSQLSPLFTLEMMGFPTDWTLLPFLSQSGETNQSKPQEMP